MYAYGNCMQAYVPAWKLMDLYACFCNCMKAYVTAYKLMNLHASLCNCMYVYVSLGNCIQAHESARILEHSGTFWNILEYSGTFWNILEHSGTFWNILEHPGTSWNILKWYSDVHCSILWTCPQTDRHKDIRTYWTASSHLKSVWWWVVQTMNMVKLRTLSLSLKVLTRI